MEARDKLNELAAKRESLDKARIEENSTSDETVEHEDHSDYKIFKGENADSYFQRIYEGETKAEIYFEYLTFFLKLPNFDNNDIKTIVDQVKNNLNITELEEQLSFQDLSFQSQDIQHTPVLDALSAKLGYSLNVVAPPTKSCLLCSRTLINRHTDRKPTLVALFSLTGPNIASKLVWTCRSCPSGWKLDGNVFGPKENITYYPDRFGNDNRGFKFYPKSYKVNIVAASAESYFEKNVVSGYWEEFSHGWLSSETKCEAYNMSHKDTERVKNIERFLEMNPTTAKHFDKQDANNPAFSDDNGDIEDDDENFIGNKPENKVSRIFEMKRKALSQAVRNFCLTEELKDRKLLDSLDNGEVFGPKGDGAERVTFKESVDDLMEKVDEWRKRELYPHRDCSLNCKKRGCFWVNVVDGLWKLSYPICMYDNSAAYPKYIRDVLPQDCTNAPKNGKAFCDEHCEQVEKLDIPTGLRQFIAYCGADSNAYDKIGKGKVKAKLAEIAQKIKGKLKGQLQLMIKELE